jgi:hypothetical protein
VWEATGKVVKDPNLRVQEAIQLIFAKFRETWWYGYSRGWWEGDALVVESTNFRDDVWLDVQGAPLTSSGTIIERFRRPSFGRLEIDVTIDDQKAYTKPWTVRVNQRLLVDTDLIEFVCNENQKFSPERIK